MLYVDTREPNELIAEIRKYISKSDFQVITLESGDMAFGNVGIERKAISDLYHTLYMKQKEGGRLWRQLDTLKRTYKQPFLLLEGTVDWSEPVLAGVLNSVLLFSNVKLIQTKNYQETAKEIVKMYNKYGTAKSGLPPPPAVVRGKTVKECRWGMLQCVRGIGPNAAKKILEACPWLFIDQIEEKQMREELAKIKGIKTEAKEMIVRVFTE